MSSSSNCEESKEVGENEEEVRRELELPREFGRGETLRKVSDEKAGEKDKNRDISDLVNLTKELTVSARDKIVNVETIQHDIYRGTLTAIDVKTLTLTLRSVSVMSRKGEKSEKEVVVRSHS